MCGTQPADKSLINRRLKAHPVPVLPIKVMTKPVLQAWGEAVHLLPLTTVIRVHAVRRIGPGSARPASTDIELRRIVSTRSGGSSQERQ